jgi:hypothetical protein
MVMDQQSALEAKRKEVREEILAMKEKVPAAQVFNWFGQLLSKRLTNRSFLYWLSIVFFLNLVTFWIWVPIGLFTKEITQQPYLWRSALMSVEMQIVGLMVNYSLMRSLFDQIADQIVEKINNSNDLSRLVEWLNASLSARNVNSFLLISCLIWISLGIGAVSFAYQTFVGLGFSLVMLCTGFVAAVALQGIYWENLFVYHLRRYQYDLNTFSPADSELTSIFPDIFNSQLYGIAAYFALYTFLGSTQLVDKNIRIVFAVPLFVMIWLGIVSQFLLTRTTLSSLIRRAKWKTLSKIQAKINSIEATGDLSDKETAEKLLRLADIHKEIMASRANTVDIRSLSTLFSQLMLPLLGLLLGNLDKVLALLR